MVFLFGEGAEFVAGDDFDRSECNAYKHESRENEKHNANLSVARRVEMSKLRCEITASGAYYRHLDKLDL